MQALFSPSRWWFGGGVGGRAKVGRLREGSSKSQRRRWCMSVCCRGLHVLFCISLLVFTSLFAIGAGRVLQSHWSTAVSGLSGRPTSRRSRAGCTRCGGVRRNGERHMGTISGVYDPAGIPRGAWDGAPPRTEYARGSRGTSGSYRRNWARYNAARPPSSLRLGGAAIAAPAPPERCALGRACRFGSHRSVLEAVHGRAAEESRAFAGRTYIAFSVKSNVVVPEAGRHGLPQPAKHDP